MARKIAINGFGRIGRQVFRILHDDPTVDIVAINDLTDPSMLAHLLKYDSVHRRFNADIVLNGSEMVVDGKVVHLSAEKDPSKLPWANLGVELVLECTGIFTSKDKAQHHITAGAQYVIISAPANDSDLTVVVGVNDDQLDSSKHKIVSNASCTTNCLAPVIKVLDQAFGIERGLMTTIHSYTNDQQLLDLPHKDKRRARAAALSMIPSSTGAAKAIGLVLPHLKGKLDGIAVRVPTPNVSLVDVVVFTKKETSVQEVNALLKSASENELKGILGFEEDELVSCDFIGDPRSSIVDAKNTAVNGGNMVKVLSWYDNEWGFSNRMVDLTKKLLGLK
jgi:glyceraldehyde 3-phosphate dehydrogenase